MSILRPMSAVALAVVCAAPAYAGNEPALSAAMTFTSASPAKGSAGTIGISIVGGGAILRLKLRALPPGPHGFHIHEGASCADAVNANGELVAAGAAGPHWDPHKTGVHLGPEAHGHLADLPRIEVGADGVAKGELRAPRITDLAPLKGRAVVIHADGDNYADTPSPLGGGGRRLACGVLG